MSEETIQLVYALLPWAAMVMIFLTDAISRKRLAALEVENGELLHRVKRLEADITELRRQAVRSSTSYYPG